MRDSTACVSKELDLLIGEKTSLYACTSAQNCTPTVSKTVPCETYCAYVGECKLLLQIKHALMFNLLLLKN